MTRGTEGPLARVAIGLVGAGQGGLALLDLLLTWPGATIAVVVDPRRDAPALTKAKALGIPTATHHLQVFSYPAKLIFEATGQPAVLDELLRAKPPGVEVMGAASLRFFWDLMAEGARVEADRRSAEEEVRRRQREAEVIADLARTINASLDLDTILQQVTDAARELCRADLAQFVLRDPDSDAMVFRYCAGGDYAEYDTWRIEPGKGAGGRVLVTGRPFRTDDYTQDPRITKDYVARVQRARMVAECVVPVQVAGRIDGLLYVDNMTSRPFTDRDEALLSQLADHAAIAMRNARLFAESERRRRAAEAVAAVGSALAQALDPGGIARTAVDAARSLLGASAAGLAMQQPESGDLVVRAVVGELAEVLGPDLVYPRGTGAVGFAVETRQAVTTTDVLADPRLTVPPDLRARLERVALRAVLAVPLLVEDRVVGALSVVDRPGRIFRADEVVLVQALANPVALALEKARLDEEATRRRREAEELARAARVFTESLQVDEVGRRVAEWLLPLFRVQSSSLRLLAPDQSVVTIAWGGRARESLDPGAITPPGQGVVGRVVVEGKPVWTPDLLEEPWVVLDEDLRQRILALNDRALLAVPLRLKGETIGVLTLADLPGRRFTDAEVALAQAFADQAALAIRNAQLYASQQERAVRLHTLVHLNQAISASLDTSTVLREIAQAASRLMEAPAVAVWVADEAARSLERRAVSDEALMTDFTLQTVRFGDGLLGWVAQHRQTLNVPDALADDRLLGPAWWRAHRLVSFLGTPIEGEGSLLGVLALNGRQPFRLQPDDDALLQSLVAQAAAAIRNARLYEERMRAYEELARTQDQLLQSQKMEAVGQLAGGVAHDFNNLLAVIIGRSELLLRRLAPGDPARRPVELIRAAGDRAAALTQQLLAFSRKQVLQPLVLDLHAVTASAERMLSRLIGENIQVVTLHGPTPCAVNADPGQLEQVILNLAINARDAMPQGGQLTLETTSVELDAAFVQAHPGARAGPHARLVVSDTGVGIAPEVQQHIFEPFFTTKAPTKGTGLGLATVFGIVKQHQGYIEVDSAPGQGATFRIYLPRVDGATEAAAPTPAGPVLGGAETLLLVEDEEAVRDLAREVLTAQGYTVVEARHPGEALLIAERRSAAIDLLLTDIVMPEMSGLELAERLTALRPGVRVCYMSGYTPDAIGQHGVQKPGVTLLQKPFTPAALARAVREVLGAARDS